MPDAWLRFHLLLSIQDIALPLTRDERWETDTLFMVFEEDYRFAEFDDPEPVMIKGSTLQEVVGEMPPAATYGPEIPLQDSSNVTGPVLKTKRQLLSPPPLLCPKCVRDHTHISFLIL